VQGGVKHCILQQLEVGATKAVPTALTTTNSYMSLPLCPSPPALPV
jgi:hypothetical protein